MIKFENVSKVYDDGFKAVDSVNFEIKEGEFLVLIGPSGSGKSTTMKMINQMIPHTNGTITIDGDDVTKLNPPELRRNIGYVIQQIGLFPHYTIERNIAIVPQLKGWDQQKIKERVKELLQMVDLDPAVYSDRYPKELSGGQQQRVGVARALASNPNIILMDEPFGALDPITRDQLQEEVMTLHQKLKKTFVFVTHDMDEALKLGDRIAIMRNGKLVQIDTPEKILHEPANEFVEDFIGKHRLTQNPEMLPVTDVMTEKVITSLPHRNPEKALIMMRQKKITSLVIADEDKTILGIVSAYDIIKKDNQVSTISEMMKPAEHILFDTANAMDALTMMPNAKYGIIPIVDEQKKIKGVVTRGTLLSTLSELLTEEGEY